jgi:hypothetical protein
VEKVGSPKGSRRVGLKKYSFLCQSLVAKSLWLVLTKKILWSGILVQKYIAPGSIIDWIRRENKSIHNVSNQWKTLSLSFLVIGSYLAWRVGDGSLVRIGVDAIMGCSRGHFSS